MGFALGQRPSHVKKTSATETQTNETKQITKVEIMETEIVMSCVKVRGEAQSEAQILNRSSAAPAPTNF